jgi:hypothetical protein
LRDKGVDQSIVPALHDRGAVEIGARPNSLDVDHAAGRAAAVERSLRPWENLDTGQVEERTRARITREVDAVEVVSNPGLCIGDVDIVANAANESLVHRPFRPDLQAGD